MVKLSSSASAIVTCEEVSLPKVLRRPLTSRASIYVHHIPGNMISIMFPFTWADVACRLIACPERQHKVCR